jgi:hypothetical protein
MALVRATHQNEGERREMMTSFLEKRWLAQTTK